MRCKVNACLRTAYKLCILKGSVKNIHSTWMLWKSMTTPTNKQQVNKQNKETDKKWGPRMKNFERKWLNKILFLISFWSWYIIRLYFLSFIINFVCIIWLTTTNTVKITKKFSNHWKNKQWNYCRKRQSSKSLHVYIAVIFV